MKIQQILEFGPPRDNNMVFLQVESENGTELLRIDKGSAMKIKTLLQQAQGNDWPEEVNELLDNGKVVNVVGIVSTSGDGWGWYEQ